MICGGAARLRSSPFSLSSRGRTPARTLAFINMVSAMSALTASSLDEAVATTRTAVEIAGPLQSSRYRRYVKDFLRTVVELHPRDARVNPENSR